MEGRYSFGDRFANSDLGPSWMVVEFRDGQLVAGRVNTARICELEVLVISGPSHDNAVCAISVPPAERQPFPEIVRVYPRSNFYRARPCSEVTARRADRVLRQAEGDDDDMSLRVVRMFLNGLTDQIEVNHYTSDDVPKANRLRGFLPMARRSWVRELFMVVEFADGQLNAGDIGIYVGGNLNMLTVSSSDAQTISGTHYAGIKHVYPLDDFKRGRVCNMSQADLATRLLRDSWERSGQFYHSEVFDFVAGLLFQLSPPDPPFVIDKCEVVVDESNSTPPKA